jgi:hypothetical protein
MCLVIPPVVPRLPKARPFGRERLTDNAEAHRRRKEKGGKVWAPLHSDTTRTRTARTSV